MSTKNHFSLQLNQKMAMNQWINLSKYLLLLICVQSSMILFSQESDNDPKEEKLEHFLEKSGDIIQVALPAAGGLVTVLSKDWEGSKELLFSVSTNLAITYALKYTIRKKRPEDSREFNAFPSGHTSSAFQGAAFIQRKYGWKYGIPSYLLASYVAYSRVEGLNDRHDVWDVIGGAIVGIGSSYLFTKPAEKNKIELTSGFNDTYKSIGVKIHF